MRRTHCEISERKRMIEILDSTNIGRLATVDNMGYPYITPVNFVFHNDGIYFHSAPKGEKLDNISRNPRVCFEVDVPLAYLEVSFNDRKHPCNTHQFFHSVVIRGRARVLPNGPLKTQALNALVAKHESGRPFTPVTEDMPDYRACVVVEIKPEKMTGKSDLAQNKPHEVRRKIAEHLAARGLDGDIKAVRDMGFELTDNAAGDRLVK
jgi:uncharacterized protein